MFISDLQQVLIFGKYKGYTVQNVIERNPAYIKWAIREDAITPVGVVKKIIEGLVDESLKRERDAMFKRQDRHRARPARKKFCTRAYKDFDIVTNA